MNNTLITNSLKKGISYIAYRTLIKELLTQKKSTGVEQAEDLLNYSLLNDKRMDRLDKTLKISEETHLSIDGLKNNYTFLVIAEGWCGDAAQIVPILNKITEASPKIDLKIVLRDENEALMEQFLTNGSKLSRENFIKMMKAGVTWITISFDGLGEEYERIRKPLKYDKMLAKIKDIKKIKEEYGVNLPVIKIQGIWPSIKIDPNKYYNTLSPYVDNIAFNPLIDYLKKPEDKVFIDDFHCPMLYQRLVVGADGLVMMCANDEENSHVVGDANDENIYNIWHGDKLNEVRELHKKENGYQELEVCRKCYLPAETEDSEKVNVNGKEITIRNYVYTK